MKRVLFTAATLIFAAAPAMADPVYRLTTVQAPMLEQAGVPTHRYQIGDKLPGGADRIRNTKAYQLSAPPLDAYYARIGQDVVLVKENSDRIVKTVSMVLRDY